jgi:hypothetical protein
MHESITLFGEVINDRGFRKKSVVLFYNKEDLFKKKILEKDLNVCFEDYKGGTKYEAALNYIKNKFSNENNNKRRQIYSYITTATDTNVVKKVFNSIHSVIIKEIMQGENMM